MHLRSAAASDIGPHRPVNQDAAFVSETVAAVADGVGGGPAGDLAAATLVHRVAAGGRQLTDEADVRTLLRISNWDIGAWAERDPSTQGMATTFTGMFVTAAGVVLAHVGDSRGYLLRAGAVHRRTRDDSFVQHLVDAGIIAPGDAATHPRRNIVTATLGGAETDGDAATVSIVDVEAGDRWMLCSDGVSDYLDEAAIGDILRGFTDPQDAATVLVSTALAAGSRDNITAVVADVVLEPSETSDRSFYGAAAERFMEPYEGLAG